MLVRKKKKDCFVRGKQCFSDISVGEWRVRRGCLFGFPGPQSVEVSLRCHSKATPWWCGSEGGSWDGEWNGEPTWGGKMEDQGYSWRPWRMLQSTRRKIKLTFLDRRWITLLTSKMTGKCQKAEQASQTVCSPGQWEFLSKYQACILRLVALPSVENPAHTGP